MSNQTLGIELKEKESELKKIFSDQNSEDKKSELDVSQVKLAQILEELQLLILK
jgi:hypothetical protein